MFSGALNARWEVYVVSDSHKSERGLGTMQRKRRARPRCQRQLGLRRSATVTGVAPVDMVAVLNPQAHAHQELLARVNRLHGADEINADQLRFIRLVGYLGAWGLDARSVLGKCGPGEEQEGKKGAHGYRAGSAGGMEAWEAGHITPFLPGMVAASRFRAPALSLVQEPKVT